MLDYVIDMRGCVRGWRSERGLEGLKRRGADHLLGPHALGITATGIKVHPKSEASQARPRRAAPTSGIKVPSGLPPLDTMLGGGLPQHSTSVLGAPLHVGLHDLLQAVRRTGARRLCIVSLAGLLQRAPDPSRLPAVCATLAHELRTLGMTSLFISEIDASGRFGVLPTSGAMHGHLSGIADNTLVLRTARRRSSVIRLMSVFKARDAPSDSRISSDRIGRGGIAINDPAPPGRPSSPAGPGT